MPPGQLYQAVIRSKRHLYAVGDFGTPIVTAPLVSRCWRLHDSHRQTTALGSWAAPYRSSVVVLGTRGAAVQLSNRCHAFG
jgi:hypothetical protein